MNILCVVDTKKVAGGVKYYISANEHHVSLVYGESFVFKLDGGVDLVFTAEGASYRNVFSEAPIQSYPITSDTYKNFGLSSFSSYGAGGASTSFTFTL